jgi:hypothetical protein
MWLATRHPAWAADYAVVSIGMFFAGRELRNVFLWTLSVLGMAAAPLYLARNPLGTWIAEVRQLFGPGTVMTILAFLTLPLAYFMSVLKKRRKQAWPQ